MSSGACRALVAVLLTLVATIVMALPVAAQDQQQVLDSSSAVYDVKPSKGTAAVRVRVVLHATRRWDPGEWQRLVVERRTNQAVTGDFEVGSRENLPGLWQAIGIETPAIPAGDKSTFAVRYTLNAKVTKDAAIKEKTPARIDNSYLYFCAVGQDTKDGGVRVKVEDLSKWQLVQLGTPMEATNDGFESTSGDRRAVGDIFTCFEGVRPNRLATKEFIGPAGRIIELQAWQELPTWLQQAELDSQDALKEIHEFLGYDIPGDGSVIVRMSPSREIGGYASAHSTPGVVQLDELVSDPVHDLAHAWFATDTFRNVWLREGLAEWTKTSIAGATCEAVTENPLELDLSDEGWLVVKPQSPDNIDELVEAQEAAACGIVTAATERMPADVWHEVLGAMLLGETKYVGSAGPEIGTSTAVNWREWLDAIDERGLVPAASDPAYAGNREDLDWAQDLLGSFLIPDEIPGFVDELTQRSEARALYHDFLDYITPLGAPHAVRKDMDDWEFITAVSRIEKSREVYDQLAEADGLLPEADLIRIVQPQFEAAKNEAELDEVAELVRTILEETRAVVVPLGELQDTLPAGWTHPAAVIDAIGEQRFDDIMAAINPAIEAAQAINAADAALPQAGILAKYKGLYESATTSNKLEDLVSDAENDRRNAVRAGNALEALEAEATRVGDWAIPAAVTDPLAAGQLQQGYSIIEDARAVLRAAQAADRALPEAGLRDEIQPLFEAVQTGAAMAILRTDVEQRAADATTVGEALSTLARLAGDWDIPAVVEDPVAAGDFAAAVDTAAAAAAWVEAADAAQDALPEIDAMSKTQPVFEAAESLEDLQAGVALAQDWEEAAVHVRRAIDKAAEPRDMLTSFGLWGVSVDPIVEDAVTAAVEGDVKLAINKSNEAIQAIESGTASGSLRLAGIVFFGVAVLGVLGLWVMLRRQRGPSWARSTTPHWVDGTEKKGLLGRGKKEDKDQ